jgi:hypothetical protein
MLNLHRLTSCTLLYSSSLLLACFLLTPPAYCYTLAVYYCSLGILLTYIDAAWPQTQRKHISHDCYLASPLARRLEDRKHTSHDSYPLFWWRNCTCAEACLSSRCLEAGCTSPLFYCCMLNCMCVAGVALQWIYMPQYLFSKTIPTG